MTFTYFAYGSNLLPARLLARCRSARIVGAATAPGHRLEFTKPGRDGSGKATLRHTPEARTPGVVYRIDLADQPALHAAEGAGLATGYEYVTGFGVRMAADGALLRTNTYVARQRGADLRPFDWYLALVVAGAAAHGLDAAHLADLRAVAHHIDDDEGRQARAEALVAFGAAGIGDYRRLLRGG